MIKRDRGEELACPSASPSLDGAVAFGVVDHSGPEPTIGYLEETVPSSPELLAMAAPLRPQEIFRFAAPCQTERCSHWSGSRCDLIERMVQLLPIASLTTPPCAIRSDCRWYAQRGRSACVRCPQVVTQDEAPTEAMRDAAQPRPRQTSGA